MERCWWPGIAEDPEDSSWRWGSRKGAEVPWLVMAEEQAGTGLAFLNPAGPAPGEGYRPEAGWQHALWLW